MTHSAVTHKHKASLKKMGMTNAVTYFNPESVSKKKSFIIMTPGGLCRGSLQNEGPAPREISNSMINAEPGLSVCLWERLELVKRKSHSPLTRDKWRKRKKCS